MKINEQVKVIKCIDSAVPIDEKYIGQIGTITEINKDRPSPISVDFIKLGCDSFWYEELEILECQTRSTAELTLDNIWVLCLNLWKWCVEQMDEGEQYGKPKSISLLKTQWVFEHKYNYLPLDNDCFFCWYDTQSDIGNCYNCPGVLIDPEFNCTNYKYHYRHEPKLFYKKIVELNQLRL